MIILSATNPDKAALVKLLKAAKQAYYNTGEFYKAASADVPPGLLRYLRPTKGVVTDAAYDQLEDALREMDPNHPLLKSVGAAPKKRKVKLAFPMASLDKHKGAAFDPWAERHPGPYVLSDKIDGISIGVKYESGNRLAMTRGDGITGGDISFMAEDLGLPTLKGKYKVRGEIVMPVSTFNKLWAAHFANPRNMVGGITNRNDLHEALSHCRVYMYDLIEPRMKPSAALAKLKELGFRVVPHKVVKSLNSAQLTKFLQARRSTVPYEMDGLVVAQDKKVPLVAGNPEHMIAFKDDAADESAIATVLNVEWNPTRTGKLFPRVNIDPIRLKGVTVTYCSGKSAARIKELGIGPGAKIRIARSGDVIPDIRECIKPVKWQQPDKKLGAWSWNGDNIQLDDHSEGEGTADTVTVKQMTFFLTTLGVERLKGATLQKFLDFGIRDVPSLLKMKEAQFLRVPGTSAKVLTGVWKQLQTAIKDVELHTLMYASGVFGANFGSRRFAAILKAIPDVLEWSGSRTALVEAVDDVEGFDLITAKQFAAALPKFRNWLKSVPSVTYSQPKTVKRKGKKCANMRVVMTGFRDAALQLEITEQGGEVIDSIKKATVLLAKDPNGSSSKLATARGLGISIMTAEQFRRKYL